MSSKRKRESVPVDPTTIAQIKEYEEVIEKANKTLGIYERLGISKPFFIRLKSLSEKRKNERLAQIYDDPFRCEYTTNKLSIDKRYLKENYAALRDKRKLCLALRPDIYTDEVIDKLTCETLLKLELEGTNSTCINSSIFGQLFRDSSKLLPNPVRAWKNVIHTQTVRRVKIEEDNFYYLSQDYRREQLVVQNLVRLSYNRKRIPSMTSRLVNTNQSLAISRALQCGVSIITGYAGTGKTYVVSQVVKSLLMDPSYTVGSILLCAPTGAAAKRMKDTLLRYEIDVNDGRISIGTIHSSIEYGDSFEPRGLRSHVRFVIVDEMSMVDLKTFSFLFEGEECIHHTRFVFVGDPGQLPSVSRGQVFKDLIASNRFQQTNLTEVVRQSDESQIVDLASQIRSGVSLTTLSSHRHPFPELPIEKNASLYLETGFADESALFERAAQLFHEEVRTTGGGDQFKVHIICPRSSQKKDGVCCKYLNPRFSDITGAVCEPFRYPPVLVLSEGLIPTPEQLREHKERIDHFRDTHSDPYVTASFRKGERLVCTKNLKSLQLVNGDMGLVEDAEYDVTYKKWEYVINFSGVTVKMDDEHLDLAYVTTVHKAQGNEYETVIFLSSSNDYWIKRELFYTAVTRAKKRLIILTLGERELRQCVHRVEDGRFTLLSRLLSN